MRNDLANPEMQSCRELLIIPSRSISFNYIRPVFSYYEDEHENLLSKIHILENIGLVCDITYTSTPKYQMSEELVKILKVNASPNFRLYATPGILHVKKMYFENENYDMERIREAGSEHSQKR